MSCCLLVVLALAACSSDGDERSNSTGTTNDPVESTSSTGSGETTTTGEVSTTATESPDDASTDYPVVDPPEPATAASGLQSAVRCDEDDPRRGLADLSWDPAERPGARQRVQVTIDPRGFGHGVPLNADLPGDAPSMLWTELSGQSVHMWRVLTEGRGEWIASAVAQFEGPLCAVDMQPLQPT